jgi:shikimate kinase
MPQVTDEMSSSQRPHAPHHAPPAVSLVGFMGAGKTTIGQALAARLGWRFVDLDDLIVARDGRTIPQIFQQSGEVAFRSLERQLLKEALRFPRAGGSVLSLGGGAFIDNTNQQLLRENEVRVVFLDAPAEELFRRCEQPGVVRPLLGDRDRFSALYEQRRPAYLNAAYCIQTAGQEIASVVNEIITRLGLDAHSGESK